MGRKKKVYTDDEFIGIGRLHGCDKMGLEYTETSARCHRDVGPLSPYGHGPEWLATFDALGAEHKRVRETRPEAVAAKKNTLRGRDQASAEAWDWTDMVTSVLGTLARKDSTVAERLVAATPNDDTDLAAKMGSLKTLLTDVSSRLPESSQAAARLAEVDALVTRLHAAPGEVHVAKGATVADTAAVDLLDGKLYVEINDVNEDARKAIRAGRLNADLSEYRLHHLRRGGRAPKKPDQPGGGQNS